MKITTFENIDKKCDDLFKFAHHNIYADINEYVENDKAVFYKYVASGKQSVSADEVKNITGIDQSQAFMRCALLECIDSMRGTHSKADLKKLIDEKLPLTLFSAEVISNQLIKNQQAGKNSTINIEELSDRLFFNLADLETKGNAFHITRGMEKDIALIIKDPAFQIVLDRQLLKNGYEIDNITRIDKQGNETPTYQIAKSLDISIKEYTPQNTIQNNGRNTPNS